MNATLLKSADRLRRGLPTGCGLPADKLQGADVIGFGFAVPPRIVTNDEVVAGILPFLDPPEAENDKPTTSQFYWEKTGILQRRYLQGREDMIDVTMTACWRALEVAGIKPSQLDFIIGATVTPYLHWPSEAARVAERLGVKVPGCDGAGAACSSFMYAQKQAYALIRAGLAKYVLVFGADDMPSAGDYTNRASFGLFGVGAGAYVLAAVPIERDSFLYFDYGQDPEFIDVISSRVLPPSAGPHPDPSVNDGLRRVTMDGPAVFKHVVGPIRKRIQLMLDATGIDPADITVCPHQPNDRMTVATFEGFGFRRVIRNVIRTGNTTSAAVPTAFGEAYLEHLVDAEVPELLPGDYVFEPAFGGGLTWGFVLRLVSEDLTPAKHIAWAPAAIADLTRMVVEIPAPTKETAWRSRLGAKPQPVVPASA